MTSKRRGLGRGFEALMGAGAEDITELTAESAGELQHLPLEQIQRGPYQPRMHFDPAALQELADSIQSQGVLQPIVVRKITEGYELIAGERRWRAAQLAQLSEIPAVVKDLPDDAVAVVALIENIQRENLNPLEEANALQRLIDEFDLTHQQVAESVGRSRASVSNLLRLLDLHPSAKELLDQGKLDMGHARAILGAANDQQAALAREVVQKKLSVRETEALVKKRTGASVDSKPTAHKDPDVERLEQDLADQIGAIVNIAHTKSGSGKLTIHYKSTAEFEGLLQRLRTTG